MPVIQIQTTNTCSSEPKCLEKIYMCPWGACLGPMERNGNEFNHLGILARPLTLQISVFKSP